MATLLVLLLCGHLLADFVFQTRAMVEGKRTRLRWLWAHGLEVLLVQAVVLLPFCMDWIPGSLAVAAIAATHVGIDRIKIGFERRYGEQLRWFVLDQYLHLAVLAAVYASWPETASLDPGWASRPSMGARRRDLCVQRERRLGDRRGGPRGPEAPERG